MNPDGGMTQPLAGRSPRLGVVAVQGGFAAHLEILRRLGANVTEVREPGALDGLDGLVLPGGESTTIVMGLERDGLDAAICAHHERGMTLLATCAGMIVLDRDHLGLLDVRCARNAYGRQVMSFEADVSVEGIGREPLRAVFIRAPKVVEAGEGVRTLAELEGSPVCVRQGRILACSFHPELSADERLHALFMAMCSVQGAESEGMSPHSSTSAG